MSKLVLFTNPQSRGRIAHWMLEEIGEPYETVWVPFGRLMKEAAYLEVNPMGKVPALMDGDAVVTETPAICAYLADRFPEKGLIPPAADPARAAYFRWLFFASGPLEMAVTAKALNWLVPEGKSGMVSFGRYDDTIGALEKALAHGPYICGEQFTAADVYVGSSLGWGMMTGSIEKKPAFGEYVSRVYARPAAQRANRLNDTQLQSLQH